MRLLTNPFDNEPHGHSAPRSVVVQVQQFRTPAGAEEGDTAAAANQEHTFRLIAD